MEWGTSFDGIFNTQNRGIQSTNAILNLLNKKHNFGAICVLLENTVNHLIENYEYCKEIGLQGIQTCIVRENVIEASNPYLVDTNIALKELEKYYKHWIYDINNPIKDINLIRQTSRLLHKTQICEDTNCVGKWIIIDPFGNIATCGMNPLKENFININEIESYTDLLTNSKYLLSITRQKILYENQCSDCKYLEVCYGGCMGLNYEINKDYKILNKRYCELVKGFLDIIYENIKNCYPDNSILVLPNRFDFKAVNKEYLKNHILEMLNKDNTSEYEDNCKFYKTELKELFDIIEKHPISIGEIVKIIKTAIPLIECGTSSLVSLILEREIYRRQLNKGEIE